MALPQAIQHSCCWRLRARPPWLCPGQPGEGPTGQMNVHHSLTPSVSLVVQTVFNRSDNQSHALS